MPRLPIRRRTLLYERLPRNGGLRLLDFCLVDTTLGAMVEPRVMNRAANGTSVDDPFDSAYTDIMEVDEKIRGSLGLNAYQWPINFNANVAVD